MNAIRTTKRYGTLRVVVWFHLKDWRRAVPPSVGTLAVTEIRAATPAPYSTLRFCRAQSCITNPYTHTCTLPMRTPSAWGWSSRGRGASGWSRRTRLGMWFGVFIPCMCTILGNIVFLRLGFIVGECGFLGSLVLLLCAFVICFLTICSLCALITNNDDVTGEVGGIFPALRESIGTELGGIVGLMFYVAYVPRLCIVPACLVFSCSDGRVAVGGEG